MANKSKVKFYFGPKGKYNYANDKENFEGVLYFATDEHTLFLDGHPYGHPIKDIQWDPAGSEKTDLTGTIKFVTETGEDAHNLEVIIPLAGTNNLAGLMSNFDKAKLDAIRTKFEDGTGENAKEKGNHEKYLNEKSEFVTLNSSNVDVKSETVGHEDFKSYIEYFLGTLKTANKIADVKDYQLKDSVDDAAAQKTLSEARNLLIDSSDDVTNALAKLEARINKFTNALLDLSFAYEGFSEVSVTGWLELVNGKVNALPKTLTSNDNTIIIKGDTQSTEGKNGSIQFSVRKDNKTVYSTSDGTISAASVVSSTEASGKKSGAIDVTFDELAHTYTPSLVVSNSDAVLQTAGKGGLFANIKLEYDSDSEEIRLTGRPKANGEGNLFEPTGDGERHILSAINVHDFLVDGMLDDVLFLVNGGPDASAEEQLLHPGSWLKMTFKVNNTTKGGLTDTAITTKVIWVPVEDLVDTYELGHGISIEFDKDTNPSDKKERKATVKVKINANAEANTTDGEVAKGDGKPFLYVDADGLNTLGIAEAINANRKEAQTTITEVAETLGDVVVQDGVTFNTSATAGSKTTFAETAATMKHELRSTNGHFAIAKTTALDGHYIYTISEKDVASASVVNNLAPEARNAASYDAAMESFAQNIAVNGQKDNSGSKEGVSIKVTGAQTELGADLTAVEASTLTNVITELKGLGDSPASIAAAILKLLDNDNYIENEHLVWHEVK